MSDPRLIPIVACVPIACSLAAPSAAATPVPDQPRSEPTVVVRVLTRDATGQPTSGEAIFSGPNSTSLMSQGRTTLGSSTKNVGGGTWSYGSSRALNGTKSCWSNYVHPTNTHSATSIIGSDQEKERKTPKLWAKTSTRGGWFETCHTYWSNQG